MLSLYIGFTVGTNKLKNPKAKGKNIHNLRTYSLYRTVI